MANLISVVIPVYNRAELVARTLASLASQSAAGFDTILVDNGSSDNTLQVLNRWKTENETEPRPITVLQEPRKGACRARNKGLEAVATPWVMFFDSDDLMRPEHISRVINGIEQHAEADIIGWNTLFCPGGVKRFETYNIYWNNLFEGNFATQRWAARTELVRKCGGWNAEVPLWNDIELGARLLAQGPKVVKLVGEITVEVYPQKESISTNANGDYLERMEPSLRSIARFLPEEAQMWLDYKRMTYIGDTLRNSNAEVAAKARAHAQKIIEAAPLRHRLLLWVVMQFRACGGRGQNHILKYLL